MPRDVEIGEGYDGSKQIVAYTPGQHNGDYMMIRGESVLVPGQFVDMGVGDAPSQGFDSVGLDDSGNAVGVGDHFDRQDWAMGDPGAGTGVGTFTEAIGSAFGGTQLNELNRAMGMMQDGLTQMIQTLGDLHFQNIEVEKLAKMKGNFITVPYAGSIPTPQGIEFLKAQKAVKDGYTRVVAYVFQTDSIADILKINEEKIKKVYGGVTAFLNSYYQWKTVFGTRLWNLGWTGELFQKMSGELWGAWLSLGGSSKGYDKNDPRFLQATNMAVEKVTGVKSGPTSPAGLSGVGALGIEPVSTTVAVILLIKTIIGVLAIVAIVVGVVMVAKEFNAKAIKIAEVRQQYEANIEAQRKEYMAKRAAEGASVATATAEWEKIRSGTDKRQEGVEKNIAAQKGLPDVAGDFLGKLALPLILVGGAVAILPMVLSMKK
jgi:hypothetical protein